jgi:hypothetical protein
MLILTVNVGFVMDTVAQGRSFSDSIFALPCQCRSITASNSSFMHLLTTVCKLGNCGSLNETSIYLFLDPVIISQLWIDIKC